MLATLHQEIEKNILSHRVIYSPEHKAQKKEIFTYNIYDNGEKGDLVLCSTGKLCPSNAITSKLFLPFGNNSALRSLQTYTHSFWYWSCELELTKLPLCPLLLLLSCSPLKFPYSIETALFPTFTTCPCTSLYWGGNFSTPFFLDLKTFLLQFISTIL